MRILGVRVDNLSQEEILRKVADSLGENKFYQIATVNPEFVLAAQKDEKFREALNGCDLNVADGFGLYLAFWKRGEKLRYRLTGADLMEEILKRAEEKKLGVFLAANRNGLSGWEETANAIKKVYPDLKIDGINMDGKISKLKIGNFGNYEVIFCNFGAPFQEKFLHSLKSLKNGKIRLAMGVGGSFDYLTGQIRRAPVCMRQLGLEWLWRLFQQPKRWKRIWNAVVVFTWKTIFK